MWPKSPNFNEILLLEFQRVQGRHKVLRRREAAEVEEHGLLRRTGTKNKCGNCG